MNAFRPGAAITVATSTQSKVVNIPALVGSIPPKYVRFTTRPGTYAYVRIGSSAVTVSAGNGIMINDDPSIIFTLGNRSIAFIEGDGQTLINIVVCDSN